MRVSRREKVFCWLVFIAQLRVSSSFEQDLEESGGLGGGAASKQEGSWSQWWSYDGISGPDYWNINKRWRLCSLGRKQSPVELRTERLIYDHLLGPIKLTWLQAGASLNFDFNANSKAEQQNKQLDGQKPVKVQLLNSGRGVEVWLENSSSSTLTFEQPQDQLILSKGPLSYAYKLFKVELHSAGGANLQERYAQQLEEETKQQATRLDREEFVPETLKSGKSSEHLIDGRSFDAELQLHFYNKHLASSCAEALQLASAEETSRPNLFAAISVFIISKQPIMNNSAASPIDFILDNLNSVQNQADSLELSLSRGHLMALVPDTKQYVTYQGSLNRPPCVESVDWILLNRALFVNSEKFRGLFEKLNTNQENIRPIKPLYRRLLRTTINNKPQRSAASSGELSSEASAAQLPVGTECRQNESNKIQCSEPSRKEEGWNMKCSMKPNYAYQLRYSKQL